MLPQGRNLKERHRDYLVTRERLIAGYNWLTGIARQYPEFMENYEQHKGIRRFPPALPPPVPTPAEGEQDGGAGSTQPADRTQQGKGAGGPRTATDLPLGERALLVLKVLLDGKAFDSDHRMTTEGIAVKAAGKGTDSNQYKAVVSELKGLGYVDTKQGRRGGCWLTASGRQRAEKL